MKRKEYSKYYADYRPLFNFCVSHYSGRSIELCIAEKDGKIILVAERDLGKQVALNLPVSYNRDKSFSNYEIWDNLSLDFRIIKIEKGQGIIEIMISRQKGYRYWGALDDEIPRCIETKKKLIVGIQNANKPVLNWRLIGDAAQ